MGRLRVVRASTCALLMLEIPGASVAAPQQVLYCWSLSESSTFPWTSTGSPFLGEQEIYLWFVNILSDGWVETEFDLVGSLEVVSFTPVVGVTSSGTVPNVHLTASCLGGIILVGSLIVRDVAGTGGSVCFSGANTTRDCGALGGVMHPHAYIGYSTDGTIPCHPPESCAIDVAVPETWGRVKAQFSR
jgi:hypothetical protein